MSNQSTNPVSSIGSTEPVQILNLAELAPVNYDWGAIKWICDMNTTPNSPQSFGYANMLPGTTNPEHRHMSCQEIIYLLAGELTVCAHGERTIVHPGQTIVIPRGVRHSVANESWESVVYIAAFSSVARQTVYKGQTGQMNAVEMLY